MNKPGRHLQALAGHLVDLYRLARFTFVNPHSYTKFRQIKSVAKRTGARMLLETGTFRGVTTRRCSPHFDRVYTIELDETLASESKAYLATRRNVEVIQGDAAVWVPKVLERPEVDRVLVFLDGHYSGGITAHGEVSEPAVMEIESLGRFKAKICAIVIDDFRCFKGPEGPRKSDLFRSLEHCFPDFDIAVHLDQVIATREAP